MKNLSYQIDETWDEMYDKKIVAMSPRPAINHNIVSGNIFNIFKNFLEGKPCIPFSDGVDLYINETNRFVPDGMVVCNKDIIKSDGVYGSPDLIIEVLSPSTAKKDRGFKQKTYESCGVKEYWIVDTVNRSIEVYLLQGTLFELDNVYSILPDYTIAKLNDEERANIPFEFSCSLFPELKISIEKVFSSMF